MSDFEGNDNARVSAWRSTDVTAANTLPSDFSDSPILDLQQFEAEQQALESNNNDQSRIKRIGSSVAAVLHSLGESQAKNPFDSL